jgi:hypothetical protein
MKSLLYAAAAAAALCSTGAAANLLINGSFENGNFTSNRGSDQSQLLATPDPSATDITGWTVDGPDDLSWLQAGNPFGITPEDGDRSVDLTGYDDSSPYTGVSQLVNLGVGDYSLTFYLGTDQSNGAYKGPVSVEATAGGLVEDFTFTPAVGVTGNAWQQETLPFSVSSAGDVTIKLQGLSAIQYLGLDNVDLESVSAAAPEPMTALPLALGLGLIGYLLRQRRTTVVRG